MHCFLFCHFFPPLAELCKRHIYKCFWDSVCLLAMHLANQICKVKVKLRLPNVEHKNKQGIVKGSWRNKPIVFYQTPKKFSCLIRLESKNLKTVIKLALIKWKSTVNIGQPDRLLELQLELIEESCLIGWDLFGLRFNDYFWLVFESIVLRKLLHRERGFVNRDRSFDTCNVVSRYKML